MGVFDKGIQKLERDIKLRDDKENNRKKGFFLLGLLILITMFFSFPHISKWVYNIQGPHYLEYTAGELTLGKISNILESGNNKIVIHYESGTPDTINSFNDYLVNLQSVRLAVDKPIKGEEEKDNISAEELIEESVTLNEKSTTETKPVTTTEKFIASNFSIRGKKEEGKWLKLFIDNYNSDLFYVFDFGNGIRKSVQNDIEYKYPKKGTFKVTLITLDKNGNSKSNSKILNIEDNSPQYTEASKKVTVPTKVEKSSLIENKTTFSEPSNKGWNVVKKSTETTPKKQFKSVKKTTQNKNVQQNNNTRTKERISTVEQISPSIQEVPVKRTKKPTALKNIEKEPIVEKTKAIKKAAKVENKVYKIVDKMPYFSTQNAAIASYISKNIKYPQAARDNEKEGKVYVQFVVNKAGEIEQPKVVRGIGFGCDEEALRLVNQMPKWNPGEQNGEKVAVLYTVPISFKLY